MRARIGRALPRSADLTPAESGLLAAAFLALVVLLTAAAANALLGVGGAAPAPITRDGVSWAISALVVFIVCLRPLRIHAQGFLISRPLPAAEIELQLQSQRRQRLSSGIAHRHDQLNSHGRSSDRARVAV